MVRVLRLENWQTKVSFAVGVTDNGEPGTTASSRSSSETAIRRAVIR
jgi:hypothetical protein